jgi:hypothetical protein
MFPENTDEDVEVVLKHLGIDGTQKFRLVP